MEIRIRYQGLESTPELESTIKNIEGVDQVEVKSFTRDAIDLPVITVIALHVVSVSIQIAQYIRDTNQSKKDKQLVIIVNNIPVNFGPYKSIDEIQKKLSEFIDEN